MEYFLFWHFSVLYKVKSNRAYIIDPANPTNNLYDDVDWKVVEMVAKVTKRKPLLRNVPVALANWKWRTTILLDLFVYRKSLYKGIRV